MAFGSEHTALDMTTSEMSSPSESEGLVECEELPPFIEGYHDQGWDDGPPWEWEAQYDDAPGLMDDPYADHDLITG